MTDMRASGFERAHELAPEEVSGVEAQPIENSREPIGMVLEIGGTGDEMERRMSAGGDLL